MAELQKQQAKFLELVEDELSSEDEREEKGINSKTEELKSAEWKNNDYKDLDVYEKGAQSLECVMCREKGSKLNPLGQVGKIHDYKHV